MSRLDLTSLAAGEGPPTIYHDVSATRRTSIAGFVGSEAGLTGELSMRIPPAEAGPRQSMDRWVVNGGGEAFQFVADIAVLVTPTRTRCDVLAQATVVTHGPFYRYALAAGRA